MHDTSKTIHLVSQAHILGFSDRFLCDDWSVDVSLQIAYEFLNLVSVVDYFALALICLDSDLLHGVCDFLEILDEVIVLDFEVFIRFVDDVDKHLSIVLESSSQSLHIVVNLKKRRLVRLKTKTLLTRSENWSTLSSSAVKLVRIVYERASLSSLSFERVLASVVSISL